MLQLFRNANYQFLEFRTRAYVVSALVILSGLTSIGMSGGLRYGIDFAGGLALRARFEQPVVIEDVRAAIESVGITGAEVQTVGSGAEVLVRAPVDESADSDMLANQVQAALQAHAEGTVTMLSADMVGPKVGAELKAQALKAIILSLIAIVLYVSARFEFRFGIAAIVTLAHDVLVVVGVLAILEREMSLSIVAALLTIVGYSLNDTIVVFDRIRENTKLMRRRDYMDILTRSINQTLGRTIITSLTTLLPVTVLLILGGQVIKDFATALLAGIMVGTYSSVFVASAILAEWHIRNPRKLEPVRTSSRPATAARR